MCKSDAPYLWDKSPAGQRINLQRVVPRFLILQLGMAADDGY
jgi:hypothetical protein